MSNLPPLLKQFSAELTRSDERQRTRVYVNGETERIETILPSGEISEIIISRSDKGYMRCFDPLNKTYRQVKLPKNLDRAFNPDTLWDWTEDGFETIDKRKCRRFIGRAQASKGAASKAYELCFIDAKTGMRRRMAGYIDKGKPGVVIDYLNAKVGPPPHGIFEFPEGYKRAYWK
jgi:hypothetical protein